MFNWTNPVTGPLTNPVGATAEVGCTLGCTLGCIVVLMKADGSPTAVIGKGHEAMDRAIRCQELSEQIKTLKGKLEERSRSYKERLKRLESR